MKLFSLNLNRKTLLTLTRKHFSICGFSAIIFRKKNMWFFFYTVTCYSFQTTLHYVHRLATYSERKIVFFKSMKQHCCHFENVGKKSQGEITSFPHFLRNRNRIYIRVKKSTCSPRHPIYMFCKCFSIVASSNASEKKVFFFSAFSFRIFCNEKFLSMRFHKIYFYFALDCVLTSTKTLSLMSIWSSKIRLSEI